FCIQSILGKALQINNEVESIMKRLWILLFVLAVTGSVYAADKYYQWVNEEVKVIITKPELDAFRALKTDPEKEQFIKDFWAKRNPTPSAATNEYKDHYESIFQQVN